MNKVLEKITDKKANFFAATQKYFMRLSLKEQIFFVKQLAIIIRAGTPLFTALNMIKKQSSSKTMKRIVEQVIKDVENGQYLATTLARWKKIFGELTINIIAVGEISGTLSDNLGYLATSLKKKQALQRKVISASVYPIFIIVATIAITIMLTVFVFPKIIPVFKSINYDLPWTTKFLIFINTQVQTHGLLIALSFIALIVAIWLLLKNKKIHFWFDKFLLSTPFIRQMIQVYNTTNICRTLGLLLNSGTVVVRAFQITSNTTTNLVYKKELDKVAEELTKGGVISTVVEKNPKLFPPIMAQMIAVGEGTGKLSETFLYLSDVYEEEMDDLTKNLSTTMEPLLLIFMGVLVGFIAISIITPIYGITQHLSPR